jgi:farnesyl diphosphate synthase
VGLAFQAADDLLDATGCEEKIGKRIGKDAVSGKQTYVRAVGMDGAREIASREVEMAVAALAPFGERAARLVALAQYTIQRES